MDAPSFSGLLWKFHLSNKLVKWPQSEDYKADNLSNLTPCQRGSLPHKRTPHFLQKLNPSSALIKSIWGFVCLPHLLYPWTSCTVHLSLPIFFGLLLSQVQCGQLCLARYDDGVWYKATIQWVFIERTLLYLSFTFSLRILVLHLIWEMKGIIILFWNLQVNRPWCSHICSSLQYVQ